MRHSLNKLIDKLKAGAHGARARLAGAAARRQTRQGFFTALFSVMGHIAKADGRVSEAEIGYASRSMDLMGLQAQRRREAIALFERGKQPGFSLDAALVQFRRDCHASDSLSRLFLEVLLQLAYADGTLHPRARDALRHAFDMLGFGRGLFERMASEAEAEAQMRRHAEAAAAARRNRAGAGAGANSERRSGADRRERPRGESAGRRGEDAADARAGFQRMLRPAYTLLGLPPDCTDEALKKAFHRQMREHHPDKLSASGASEEMLRLATERTQQIKAAYDQIRAARGLRG